ncbi:hypothetical protein A0J61_09667, partial [Choanephora cucurbitarum]
MRPIVLFVWLAFTVVSAESNALFADHDPLISTMELKDDTFVPFHWKGSSGFSSTTFHIDVVDEARVFVTDYLDNGDIFELYDNDQLVGSTSEPNTDQSIFKATPEEAVMENGFSKGLFLLTEGSHTITIKALSSHTEGTGAIRLLSTDVPVDFHRFHHHQQAAVADTLPQEYTDYLYYFNGAIWGPLSRADAATAILTLTTTITVYKPPSLLTSDVTSTSTVTFASAVTSTFNTLRFSTGTTTSTVPTLTTVASILLTTYTTSTPTLNTRVTTITSSTPSVTTGTLTLSDLTFTFTSTLSPPYT